MIHIGICDDKKQHRELLKENTCKALFQYDEVKFSIYNSGEEVIEAIEEKRFFCELLLLDIHMPGKSGLDVAAYIRERQVDVDIIFVTVSSEYVYDGYTYRAFSYLLKPIDVDRINSELQRYVKMKQTSSKCLHVNIGGKRVQIILDQIKYFTSDGRKIMACKRSEEDEISFYAKLNELEKTLREEGFLRCHQSYLVNTKYVQAYSRTEIDVEGEFIPISRRYVEEVRKQFA